MARPTGIRRSHRAFIGRCQRWLLKLELLEDRRLLAPVSWDGEGGDLQWSNRFNWSNDQLPTAADDVTIAATGDVAIIHGNGATTIKSLVLADSLNITGGTLAIVNTFSISAGKSVTVSAAMSAFSAQGAATISGGSFIVSAGGMLSLPGATDYSHTAGAIADVAILQATGAGSVLDFPNVTTVSGCDCTNDQVWIRALGGGQVRLPRVTTITTPVSIGGAVRLTADGSASGTGSRIDLPLLTTFTDSDISSTGSYSGLSALIATGGGTIDAPSLTTVTGMELTLDAMSTIPTAQIVTLNGNSIVTVNGSVPSFAGLMNIESTSFVVNGGGTLSLPTIMSLVHAGGTSVDVLSFVASGVGSVLDFPNVTTVTGGDGTNDQVWIRALGGGQVRLPHVTTITTPVSIGGSVRLTADGSASGTGSRIDLPLLTTFTDSDISSTGSYSGRSALIATNRGMINVGSDVFLQGVEVSVSTGGTIFGGRIDLQPSSQLSGQGEIFASVRNNGSTVAVGMAPIGLAIYGDYMQSATGKLIVTIDGPVQGNSYSRLVVDGLVTLAGTLEITRAGNFTPDLFTDYAIITAESRLGTFDTVTGGTITGGDLTPQYGSGAVGLSRNFARTPFATLTYDNTLANQRTYLNVSQVNLGRTEFRVYDPSGSLVTLSNATAADPDWGDVGPFFLEDAGTYEVRAYAAPGENPTFVAELNAAPRTIQPGNFTNVIIDGISSAGATDIWEFGVQAGDQIGLDVRQVIGAGQRLSFTLKDPAGRAFFHRTVDASSFDSADVGPFAAPFSGVYSLTVDGIGDDTASYEFFFSGPQTPRVIAQLSLSTSTASEADATMVTVTATTDLPVTGDQTLDVSVTGIGITSGDYVLSGGTILIPDGQTTGFVTLTVVDDDIVEGTETAIIRLVNPSVGILLGSVVTQELVILDNDFLADLTVPNVFAPPTAEFGGSISFDYTVANIGLGPAELRWSDRVYLSSDLTVDPNDLVLSTFSLQGPLAAAGQPNDAYTRNGQFTVPLTAGLPADSYFILVQTDTENNQLELREDNNLGSRVITLNYPALPDLAIGDISVQPVAISGQDVQVRWTLDNRGTGAFSGSFNDQVCLSADTVIGNDAPCFEFPFTGTIAANGSITRVHTISLPSTLVGMRYIVVRTDTGNAVFELPPNGDSNNVTIDDQAIDIQPRPDPNLQVVISSVTPTAVAGQTTVRVDWTVANVGTGQTNAPFWVDRLFYSLDNTFSATSDRVAGDAVNPRFLGAGSDSYVSFLEFVLPVGLDGALLSGNLFFFVVTDFNGQVAESNEEDNINVVPGGPTIVQSPPLADLQVTSVQAPDNAVSSQSLTINWTVTNTALPLPVGGPTTSATWSDRVYLSQDEFFDGTDTLMLTAKHSGILQPGESYQAFGSVSLAAGLQGPYYFIVFTDYFGTVFESNNGNNWNLRRDPGGNPVPTSVLLVTPDLRVTSVAAPPSATASRLLQVDYRVANLGVTATPNSTWVDRLILSSTMDPQGALYTVDRTHSGPLNHPEPGQPTSGTFYDASYAVILPDTLTGTLYAFICTDFGNVVFEGTANDNNCGYDTEPIVITSQPADLSVAAPEVPNSAAAGQVVPFRWTVQNLGVGDSAVTSWVDRVILSTSQTPSGEVLRWDRTHSGLLLPSQSYTVQDQFFLPVFLAPGNYFFLVIADAGNHVYEPGMEGNNLSVATPITISRVTADLQTEDVIPPSMGRTGEIFPVSWTVSNLGLAATETNLWFDKIYLSRDADLSSDDVVLGQRQRNGVLGVNEAYTQQINVLLPEGLSGEYFTIVCADATGLVVEGNDENNNCRASQIITMIQAGPKPDLEMVGVNAPSVGVSGQPVTIEWTVGNNGDTDASGTWIDTVYLSLDQVFDPRFDRILGTVTQNRVFPRGGFYSESQPFTIPLGFSGPLWVFVQTDSTNRIAEVQETDNLLLDLEAIQVTINPLSDLEIGSVTGPPSGISGQPIDVDYTVVNVSSSPASGTWFDSVYLSSDATWDIDDQQIGTFARPNSGDVPPNGGTYSSRVSVTLPGLVPDDYFLIVRADIRNQLAEVDEMNNSRASAGNIAVDSERLELGVPLADRPLSQGGAVFYRLDTRPGESIQINLATASTSGLTELYASYGEFPTRNRYDVSAVEPFQSDQRLIIPSTLGGTYYILAYGTSVPNSPTTYTILADELPFTVFDTSFGKGSNSGNRTFAVHGGGFNRTVAAQLTKGAGFTLDADRIWYTDASRIYPTFDLTGVAPGFYDVVIDRGAGVSQTVVNGLEVIDGTASNSISDIDGAPQVRPDRTNRMAVTYGNDGKNDIPTPLLAVTTDTLTPFGLQPNDLGVDLLQLYGNVSEGPPDIIIPGASFSAPLYFSSVTPDAVFSVASITVEDANPFDWPAVKSRIRPVGLSDMQWDARFSQLQSFVGPTKGDYVQAINAAARTLAGRGQATTDIAVLFQFVYEEATGEPTAFIGGRVDDLNGNALPSKVVVDLYQLDAGSEIARFVQTAGDGRFTFDRLPAGDYQLRVRGYTGDATILTIAAGGEKLDARLVVSGPVTANSFDGLPDTDQAYAVAIGGDGIRHIIATLEGAMSYTRFENVYLAESPIPNVNGNQPQLISFGGNATTRDSLLLVYRDATGRFGSSLGTPGGIVNGYGFTAGQLIPGAPATISGTVTHAQLVKDAGGVPAIFWTRLSTTGLTRFVSTWTGTAWAPANQLGSQVPFPATTPLVPIGSPQPGGITPFAGTFGDDTYYQFRYQDFVNRHPGMTPPDYYLGYGDAFLNALKPNTVGVSPLGEAWLQQSRAQLQQLMESALLADPILEQDPLRLRDLGFAMHADAFVRSTDASVPTGLLDLPLDDWKQIIDALKATPRTPIGWNPLAYVAAGAFNLRLTSELIRLDNVITAIASSLAGGGSSLLSTFANQYSAMQQATAVAAGGLNLAAAQFGLDANQQAVLENTLGTVAAAERTILGTLQEVRQTLDVLQGADPVLVVEAELIVNQLGLYLGFGIPAPMATAGPAVTPAEPTSPDFDLYDVDIVAPNDPDDIQGPAGFGPERWIPAVRPIPYTIRFENDPVLATSPVQVLRVTQTLDPDLDPRSFRLGGFGFGNFFFEVPANRAFYVDRLDVAAELGVFLDVAAGVNVQRGEIFWEFRAIDPATGEPPVNAQAGFLPPNTMPPLGDGFVTYTVSASEMVPTRTVIDAFATIIFDTEPPMDTPSTFNTLDADKPNSSVTELNSTSDDKIVEVIWTGTDNPDSSGLASFDVYVSENGRPYEPWQLATTLTSSLFFGKRGRTYEFYSVARDNSGNEELPPTVADDRFTVAPSEVVSRHVFYNNSVWDGYSSGPDAADDQAIATGIRPLRPGENAGFANYTNFDKGLNGVMIDVTEVDGNLSLRDFQFRVGNSRNLQTWTEAPSPIHLSVRPGEGSNGADRVTLIWQDGAIQQQWMEITILPLGETGLAAPDVFYFGNAIGEVYNQAGDTRVNATDMVLTRRNYGNVDISSIYDHNRDGVVDPADLLIVQNHQTTLINDLELLRFAPRHHVVPVMMADHSAPLDMTSGSPLLDSQTVTRLSVRRTMKTDYVHLVDEVLANDDGKELALDWRLPAVARLLDCPL